MTASAQKAARLLLTAALILFVSSPVEAQTGAVREIAIRVADLDRSVRFYSDVLSFTAADDPSAGRMTRDSENKRARSKILRLGSEQIVLYQAAGDEVAEVPADSKSNDLWFQHLAIVVSDMERAYSRLERYKVAHVSPAPQELPQWNEKAGGIKAYYFQDPDRHNLELIWFPRDKGPSIWQQPDGRLFLGIDHTAIAVKDTEASLKFYRDELGFTIAGSSENFGPEQEMLNNVAGAHLLITSLRTPAGPGVELLQYVSPAGGRPRQQPKKNDLSDTETVIVIPADNFSKKSPAPSATVSSEPVPAGQIIRDPDGHAVTIVAAASIGK